MLTIDSILSVEPTIREAYGSYGVDKFRLPYQDMAGMEQLRILALFAGLGMVPPANDMWEDEFGWFY